MKIQKVFKMVFKYFLHWCESQIGNNVLLLVNREAKLDTNLEMGLPQNPRFRQLQSLLLEARHLDYTISGLSFKLYGLIPSLLETKDQLYFIVLGDLKAKTKQPP